MDEHANREAAYLRRLDALQAADRQRQAAWDAKPRTRIEDVDMPTLRERLDTLPRAGRVHVEPEPEPRRIEMPRAWVDDLDQVGPNPTVPPPRSTGNVVMDVGRRLFGRPGGG